MQLCVCGDEIVCILTVWWIHKLHRCNLKHTHTCWNPSRTGLYQYQYPGCCIIVLEHVTIGGKWAKCTQDLTVLFLTISYGPTITSIKVSINNNNTDCH